MERREPQPVGELNLGEIPRAPSNKTSNMLGQAEFSRMTSGLLSLIWYGTIFPLRKLSFPRKFRSARVNQEIPYTHQQNGSSWAPMTKPATRRQPGPSFARIFQALDTNPRPTSNFAQCLRKSRKGFAVWEFEFFKTQAGLKLGFKVFGSGRKLRCDCIFSTFWSRIADL